jgi:peptide/nickel transport system permease protein
MPGWIPGSATAELGVGPRASEPAGPAISIRRRWRSPGLVSFIGVGMLMLMALLGPTLAPFDPTEQVLDRMLEPPGRTHWLGTDDLGRDILSRILYGARVSLGVGVLAVALSLSLGVVLGLVSGYHAGWLDGAIMRVMDGLLAFPSIVLALAITAALGPSLQNAMIAIGIIGIPGFARLVRGQVLALRTQEFVEAARALGAGDRRIVVRHIVPGTIAAVVIHASLRLAFAVLTEAGLSFLGLGAQPPTPSWGGMLNTGREYLEMAPWLSLAPGAAIFLTTLSFNFLGDAVRDALDPRLRT